MDLDQKPAVTDLQQEDKNLQELAIAMAIALG